jgi:hypothetical protein
VLIRADALTLATGSAIFIPHDSAPDRRDLRGKDSPLEASHRFSDARACQ